MYRTPNPVRSTSQLSQLPTAAINRTIFSSNKRDQYLPIIKQISELFALPIPFTTRDIHVMDVNKVPFIIYHLIIDIDHNAIFQNGNIPNSNDNGNNQTSNNLLFRLVPFPKFHHHLNWFHFFHIPSFLIYISFRFHIIQKLTAFETLLINNNNNKAREKINFVELMFTYENNSDTDDRRDLFIRTLNMLCNFKIFLNELMVIKFLIKKFFYLNIYEKN